MKTVAQLKTSVSGSLSGLNMANVIDLNNKLERAARTLIQKADVLEATDRTNYILYDGVFDYPAPVNIFGGALIDLRPQGTSRSEWDYNYRVPIEQFDREKKNLPNGYEVTFEWDKGVPIMRVAQTKTEARVMLDPMTATTGWAAGGSATGLALDQTVFYDNGASLRFNLAASGSQGTLTKTISSQDLSRYVGVGSVFVAIRMPTATNITSVGVKVGSSASNYYQASNTTGFVFSFRGTEWFLVQCDLSTATTVGTPVSTAMTYLQVFVNYDGTALTNVYVGQVFTALPSPHTLITCSAAIFMPTTGANTGVPQLTITNDTDQILLNDAAYTLYELESAREVAVGQGGKLSNGTIQTLQQRLDKELYPMYHADNPSNEVRSVGSYYDNDRWSS